MHGMRKNEINVNLNEISVCEKITYIFVTDLSFESSLFGEEENE